jgi:hypothetical protein
MDNFILNAVGPSGGPVFCNTDISNVAKFYFAEACSTKTATCCHTPLFAFTAPFGTPILMAPLDTPGFYESYNANNTSEMSGCLFARGVTGNVDFRSATSGQVVSVSGGIGQYSFYVNNGASINIDYTMIIPYIESSFRSCYDLGRLEIRNADPNNVGDLSGDWFKNCPSRAEGSFSSYNCENNPSIENIFKPYPSPTSGTSGNNAGCPTRQGAYNANINSFFYAGGIEDYFCSPANYCCSCYEPATGPTSFYKSCNSGTCNPRSSRCSCVSEDLDSFNACFLDIPYVTLQGSYQYTCDVPCGVSIQLILGRAFDAQPYFGNLFPGEKGYINVTCSNGNCLP